MFWITIAFVLIVFRFISREAFPEATKLPERSPVNGMMTGTESYQMFFLYTNFIFRRLRELDDFVVLINLIIISDLRLLGFLENI